MIPNACRSSANQAKCKHEAPWSNRVSPAWMTQPLLVCEGVAKPFHLLCSGARNWLGQMLLVRNDAWVNGTMPGLCVAFAGSNTDVKPNDRLPILPETHEPRCERKACKKTLASCLANKKVNPRHRNLIDMGRRTEMFLTLFCFSNILIISSLFSGYMAFYFLKMLKISYEFQERSEGADEILIWIPQTSLAFGSFIFFICILHHLFKAIKND